MQKYHIIYWSPFQEAYILLISLLYLSWMSFLFNLNAAVTRPMSGDQTSVTSFTAAGISNFSNLSKKKSLLNKITAI